MIASKRHLVKTITWRIIGSIDTFLLAYVITGNFENGLKISSIELISKMLLYFFHEKLWFNSNFSDPNKRHILKTFTWRIIGTTDTVIVSTIISGNPFIGLKVGIAETISKMILYYLHEKIWYRSNYGLKIRRNDRQKNKI